MDVNSLRFTPDRAGQTCVCSCCLRSCWGTGWGVRLSKLPTCEVSKTKTLGYVQSHLYGKKEEEKKKQKNRSHFPAIQPHQTVAKNSEMLKMKYYMTWRPPQTSSARSRVMRVRWRVSNKPTELLFWVILRADCQQQVAGASGMDSQQALYSTQSHHWWAMEVEGVWWRTNIQMCSVGCTLTKSGSLREKTTTTFWRWMGP